MTVELWLHLEHGVPRMSDPMNERPGDPQPPPPEAERKSSSPLIWILILIALIAFAWYFYNRNAGSESIGDLAPPAATSAAMTPAPRSPAEGDASDEKSEAKATAPQRRARHTPKDPEAQVPNRTVATHPTPPHRPP